MAKYYYLISSLPMLKADEKSPISYEDFIKLCSEHLKKKDFEDIKKISFTPSKENANSRVVKAWVDYIKEVDEILKEERLCHLGWNDEKERIIVKDPVLKDRIHRSVYTLNPLDAEKEILSIYFDFLSSHNSFDHFSSESLMIYALQIQILERISSFSQEKGREEFKALFERIQSQFE